MKTPADAPAPIDKVNLQAAFATFHDYFSPKIAAELNNFQVKLVKIQGAFEWHHHDREDELFLIVQGRMRMNFRHCPDVEVGPGEFIVVPHGVEHLPEALTDECHLVLLEPSSALNTGNVESKRTVRVLDRLAPAAG